MMTAGGVTLAGLGVLVGLAIGSGDGGSKLVAQRVQPVEVRTEVVRKTVNVYRRAKPHHVAAAGPGGARSTGATAKGSTAAVYSSTRTRTSGAHAATPAQSAAPVVSTRSSGARPTSSSGSGSGSQTVKTRTSGAGSSGGSSGSSHAVTTRSSGGGDNGGGHDD
jgi:hypothetical protein